MRGAALSRWFGFVPAKSKTSTKAASPSGKENAVNDPSTLSFALTYAGTLGVAVLLFFGQVMAFTALLVLAGAIAVLGQVVHVVSRRIRR
jgi:hypothetical protein